MKLYEYLGFLMGCCIRTNVHLSLDFPQLVWKQIQEQPTSINDLYEVDKLFCEQIQFIQNSDKDSFEEC